MAGLTTGVKRINGAKTQPRIDGPKAIKKATGQVKPPVR